MGKDPADGHWTATEAEPSQRGGARTNHGGLHNIRGGTEYSPVRNKQEDTSNIVRIRKNI